MVTFTSTSGSSFNRVTMYIEGLVSNLFGRMPFSYDAPKHMVHRRPERAGARHRFLVDRGNAFQPASRRGFYPISEPMPPELPRAPRLPVAATSSRPTTPALVAVGREPVRNARSRSSWKRRARR